MNTIAIIVGTISIIIIVALAKPAINRSQQRIKEQKQKQWSADLLANKARIQTKKHYAYESWRQEIAVDADGNASHSMEAHIINIGENPLEQISFPIYCDAKNVQETQVQPWASCEKDSLPAKVKNWIVEHGRGQVVVSITPPLEPGKIRNIKWGYNLPLIFATGDEYYNWDISTPHFEIGGKLRFSKPWNIKYAKWDPELATIKTPPKIKKNTISWLMHSPELGKRITMRFGLSKKG